MRIPFSRPGPGWLLALLLTLQVVGAEMPVRHLPVAPRSGQAVQITVSAGLDAKDEPVLEIQAVAPGRYVALADPGYNSGWTELPLGRADSGAFMAEVPAKFQRHRHLIRYRIRSVKTRKQLLPLANDAQGNFAYYVYDGVPAWHGAINPRGDGPARQVETYSPEALTRVPVYQLVAARKAVETAMWQPTSGWRGGEARHDYGQTGTLVCDGVVHDHVKFRARGGSWRHAMGKNMWKFNFNPGHRLAAQDAYGRAYAGKWDKLNLGACIQQGDYGMRGEQGMFEAVTYRLFNLAGSAAPRTHWVHFRVVTGAEETPADQYAGDFWGLYLAVEEIDGDFLKEHGLPDGNVYKIDGFEPHPQHFAKGQKEDPTDARNFLSALRGGGARGRNPVERDAWWARNVELDRYYGYRSVLEAVHHYDVGGGKNYFFHHNLAANRWQVIPWDVDLTWGDHMFGDGGEPFYRAGILHRSPFAEAYQQRLAELRDLLLNSDQLGRLIDEHAAMIWDGPSGRSLADADRAKWDYHPIMSSRYVMDGKSAPGLFYLGSVENRFDVMPKLMKEYARRRQANLDRLLTGYTPPPAPQLSGPAEVAPEKLPPKFAAKTTAGTEGRIEWRLAEVTDPKSPGFDPKRPWRYEIEALWEQAGGPEVTLPPEKLERGHTYRVRARSRDAAGQPSRWSAAVEFVAR